MYRLFVIAKNNMKKQKGDMITFLLLTFLAALMIFDCISAMTGIGSVLDEKFKEVNGADVMLYTPDNTAARRISEKAFEENEHIAEYEVTPQLDMIAKFRKKGERDFNAYSFFVEAFDEEKRLMNIERPKRNLLPSEVLLPYNMKGTFSVGDVIQLKLDDDVYDFTVAGYLEDPYFCATINISVYCICLDRDVMEELADGHPNLVIRQNIFKGRLSAADRKAGYPTTELEREIEDRYKDERAKYDGEGSFGYLLINWDMMKDGSSFLPLIIIALILVFAVLILAIAIVIISFSINNFIRKNMKNTGILEACGYTVSELRWALTLQIAIVATIGSILGVTAGILTFDYFGNIISLVLGLSWNQPADQLTAAGTVLGIVLLIVLVARAVSRAYKKVSVLDALRGGINTHNFRKNFFPFETSPFPIPLVLALKDTFGGLGRNLLMVFIVALLAVSTLVGFGMYENFGTDPKTIMDIMSVEVGTAMVEDNSHSLDYKELGDAMRQLDSVDSVLAISNYSPTVVKGDREMNVSTSAYDDVNNTRATKVVEGRIPESDNEVMVSTGIAKDLNIRVGDVITLKYSENEADYMVVGINQALQNMGRTMIITMDGIRKIFPGEPHPGFYVYAKDHISYRTLERQLLEMVDEEGYDLTVTDMQGFISGTVDSVVMATRMLCIVIVFITCFVVIFVEALVIRAKISKEWHNMGVSKALGQTTRELVTQIMLSNLPAIACGTLIGVLLSQELGKKAISAAFSLFEMNDIAFRISPVWMILTVTGILLIAVLTAGFEGLKVKRLIPVEMITED